MCHHSGVTLRKSDTNQEERTGRVRPEQYLGHTVALGKSPREVTVFSAVSQPEVQMQRVVMYFSKGT